MGPLFDWWIIPHIAFFIFLASAIHAAWEPPLAVHASVWLFTSYGWELCEYFLSRAYPETWVVLEPALGAWVLDPVSNGVGYLIGVAIGAWSKGRRA